MEIASAVFYFGCGLAASTVPHGVRHGFTVPPPLTLWVGNALMIGAWFVQWVMLKP